MNAKRDIYEPTVVYRSLVFKLRVFYRILKYHLAKVSQYVFYEL